MKRKMMPEFMQDDEITTKKQTKITKYTLPALTSDEQSKFENLLACHYYATGTSFLRVDCPFLHSALKTLRPDLRIPSRQKIGGELLDRVHEKVESNVFNHIYNNNSMITIGTDSSEDTNRNSITACFFKVVMLTA
jgi:hypothetical protein